MTQKRIDFEINGHQYSCFYDDVKYLINHLVDVAETERSNFDLGDCFAVVKRLAEMK